MNLESTLPSFKYHPDPVATGSITVSESSPCLCCARIRGYIYNGPAYSELFHHLTGSICPWCIADGSAARRFRAEFSDTGTMEDVETPIADEIGHRTPGFHSWQQERWLTCCGDAAAYLGPAGTSDIKELGAAVEQAVEEYVRDEYEMNSSEAREFMQGLQRESGPTAQIFRCLHCSKYRAYVDAA